MVMQNIDSETALKHYQQALLHNPKDLDAQIICGNLCVELNRFEEAAGYFRRIVHALKTNLNARNALCYCLEMLGNNAQNAGNFAQAEASFAEALEYQPGNAIHWYNLGNAQRDLGKTKTALHSFKQSIQFDPNDADAHNNLGNVLRELGQLDKAILSYETALKLNPNLHHALAHLVHQKQHICDWSGLDAQIEQLREWVKTEPKAQISPFAFLSMPNTMPQEQLQCASNYANSAFKHLIDLREKLNFQHNKTTKTKLKIGYLSADFRLHPLAFLITDLIKNHDKNHFETVAYSYGSDDKTPVRKQLEQVFDQFHDIRTLNDAEAATKIHADNIDILVDLTGYTQNSRTDLIALKPAPISINWLGYPGTMGELAAKPLFNYIIADKFIAPNTNDFSEEIIYLPCYQPNNASRPVGNGTTKFEHNLPKNVFVFCCFNQSFKITTEIFAAWMQILKAVPNSVLWLLDCNQWAKANLQASTELAGIAKERLIFASRMPIEDHLARHIHADLFLDTLHYNAHTTASDALFMGLPLLTCIGKTLASRVAASLLYRINCEDLVTDDMTVYVQKAIELASNPAQLLQLKQKIRQSTDECKLFDPAYFMQELTLQYKKIWSDYIISM
jgi:protein O-GlcNAc transferase